ncbi:UNVERIFIED_CONTAM: hypothetical protein Sradi_4183000 [Sesamum radiatum]|uniref:Uncharacterized protein n=1 Tax=Sesamum radiatum TaxID=300843 RepID=A0AAW2P482_SESRA
MAKRFKLRICRVINTTLQSCRSKDPSILPEDPIPSFSRPNPPQPRRPAPLLQPPPLLRLHILRRCLWFAFR